MSNKRIASVKTKQWGHSLGIIIPAEIVKDLKLKSGVNS